MIHTPLKLETVKHHALKERLLANWPACDEETLRDTLEGITHLHEMIAAVIRSALVDEALHAGLRFRLDDMKERLSRLELRASKKRELALPAMAEAGLRNSSSRILPPQPGSDLPPSWSLLRTKSRKPTGFRSPLSSIGSLFWQSSKEALTSWERK